MLTVWRSIGIRVVVVHVVGPDAADLDYLDTCEAGGLFAAPATLIVQNAGLVMTPGGVSAAFAAISDHKTVQRVKGRGGVVTRMPLLVCMLEVTKRKLGFVEAYEGKAGPDGTAIAFLDRVGYGNGGRRRCRRRVGEGAGRVASRASAC